MSRRLRPYGDTLGDGVDRAREAIASGKAAAALETLARVTSGAS